MFTLAQRFEIREQYGYRRGSYATLQEAIDAVTARAEDGYNDQSDHWSIVPVIVLQPFTV